MVKKFFLILIFFILMLSSVNAILINDCSIIPSSNTNYELSAGFNYNSPNCFNFLNKENISITGTNEYMAISIISNWGNAKNISINKLNVNSFSFIGLNPNLINFNNNYLHIQNVYFNSIITTSGTISNLNMINNTIINTQSLFYVYWNFGSGSSSMVFKNLTLEKNDFISKASIFRANGNNVNQWGIITFLGHTNFINNNFGTNQKFYQAIHPGTFNAVTDCSNFTYFNNYDSFFNGVDVIDMDSNFFTDSLILYNIGGCSVSNQFQLTHNSPNNPQNFKPNSKFLAYAYNNPFDYEDDTRYIYTNPLKLNSTRYISIIGKTNVTLDISFLNNVATGSIKLTGTNQIRLGSENKLYGGGSNLISNPLIKVDNLISVNYDVNNVFSTRWGLIGYNNYVNIEGINFDTSNFIGSNFGILQPTENTKGEFLLFKNNRVNYGSTMFNNNIPTILYSNNLKALNNDFTINNKTSIIFKTSSTFGGSLFQDNTFQGVVSVFQDVITSPNTIIPNIANHNQFAKWGTMYSYPFNPSFNGLATNNKFFLNSTYYYNAGCDSYPFNIGNWYEDLIDFGVLNDTDFDDIDNVGWVRSSVSDDIKDERVLLFYPHDFATNTGSIIPENNCGTLSYVITSPVENITYSSGVDVLSSWSYVSNLYDDLTCTIKINDQSLVFFNIMNNVVQSNNMVLSNGYFNYKINCDTGFINFDSPIINFCVGNCLTQGTLLNISTPPITILGCTDSLANNYNPSATQDDGSCTYTNGGGTGGNGTTGGGITTDNLYGGTGDLIVSGDISQTGDNVVSFFQELTNGSLSILIPLGLFIFVILMIGGTMAILK